MKRTGRTWLLAALGVASATAALDVAGRAAWSWATAPLDGRPAVAADRLRSFAVGLPEAVDRSRRLLVSSLAPLGRAAAAEVLDALSVHQRRWMPADPAGYTAAARARVLAGEPAEGAELFGQAILRDPTSPVLRRLAAVTAARLGREADVRRHLVEAIAADPRLDAPDVEMTSELRTELRIEGLRRRLELYPRQRASGSIELADALRGAGRGEEADEVLRREAAHPAVAVALARQELDAGEVESAVVRLEALSDRRMLPARERSRALALLAQAYEMLGDSERATSAAERAVATGEAHAGAYVALAVLAGSRGDDRAELEYLRKARGLDPRDPRLLLRLASAADRAGEVREAVRALERAVELAPDEPRYAERLVSYLRGRGDLHGAVYALTGALDRHPTDPRLLALAERLRRDLDRQRQSPD